MTASNGESSSFQSTVRPAFSAAWITSAVSWAATVVMIEKPRSAALEFLPDLDGVTVQVELLEHLGSDRSDHGVNDGRSRAVLDELLDESRKESLRFSRNNCVIVLTHSVGHPRNARANPTFCGSFFGNTTTQGIPVGGRASTLADPFQ